MRNALIIVDYQNDFVNGALGFPGAERIAPAIVKKIESALAEHTDLIFTFDTHTADYPQTQEGKKLPVPHCIKDTDGWRLHASVAPYAAQAVKCIEKPGFGSLELAAFCKDQGYDTVELAGLVSSICVISNAVLVKTALPEAEIVVDAQCTDGFDNSLHNAALDVMEGLQITVLNR